MPRGVIRLAVAATAFGAAAAAVLDDGLQGCVAVGNDAYEVEDSGQINRRLMILEGRNCNITSYQSSATLDRIDVEVSNNPEQFFSRHPAIQAKFGVSAELSATEVTEVATTELKSSTPIIFTYINDLQEDRQP